jgi:hypothetical protein
MDHETNKLQEKTDSSVDEVHAMCRKKYTAPSTKLSNDNHFLERSGLLDLLKYIQLHVWTADYSAAKHIKCNKSHENCFHF